MIAAQPLNLAFEDLFLDGSRSFVVALCGKKISESCHRPQAQILVLAAVTAQIPYRSFEQRTRMTRFPRLPVRNRNLGHQTKSLRVIRSQPGLVRA